MLTPKINKPVLLKLIPLVIELSVLCFQWPTLRFIIVIAIDNLTVIFYRSKKDPLSLWNFSQTLVLFMK